MTYHTSITLPQWLSSKESACNAGAAGDLASIPGSVRSPGGGKATHSSILAWRIPWTEEPGELQSIGSQRVVHNWSNLARTHFYNTFPSYFLAKSSATILLIRPQICNIISITELKHLFFGVVGQTLDFLFIILKSFFQFYQLFIIRY